MQLDGIWPTAADIKRFKEILSTKTYPVVQIQPKAVTLEPNQPLSASSSSNTNNDEVNEFSPQFLLE